MSATESNEVNINKEDQAQINQFARFNQRLQELENIVATKTDQIQKLQDAEEELMLGEDTDEVPYLFGDVFISLTSDDVQARLESDKESLGKELETFKEQVSEIKSKMAELKAALYGKFGSNINLEG
ncbi:prefoldin subunit 4-like [Varroa jacobsoni]|uniref:Prefoldin subunit 4 n=1 Tax=Varroa destructor TaxID=109461 RepID=A0A7M7JD59_VARDE|nr:prefoldin subunit 4-like [Varroa destructor]XP_022691151.1 prefoldin subunit 4-like [Varroa jacobsoni]XP_022691152.1 prefoldin subunit 4-like [Varroa jacobsoni]XP_022691153.1 prefoldin subunit 4-like [Varroa jacobsoni]